MMGVADMPIETLKLLNIHPDARAASKKGKERAQASESTSNTGESSRLGGPTLSRTVTGADSVRSGESTPSAVQSPGLDEKAILSPDARENIPKNSASSTGPVRSETSSSSNFKDNLKNMQADSAVDTGKGLARIVGTGFKSPMDFSLNVAKGFHNVPKLYGGEVRKVDNVTDLKSGLSTAAKVSATLQTRRTFANLLAAIRFRTLRRYHRTRHRPLQGS